MSRILSVSSLTIYYRYLSIHEMESTPVVDAKQLRGKLRHLLEELQFFIIWRETVGRCTLIFRISII